MSTVHDHSHDHSHGRPLRAAELTTDGRWLLAALAVIVAFMVGEVVSGMLSHSLALIADAGHMLTDAVGIGLAVLAARIAQRPARGAYTYGFARVDALSGQANGITLVLLAIFFVVEAVRRLVHPDAAQGAAMTVVALIGVGVNLIATVLVSRANRASLNVRGVFVHLLTDLWAFVATAGAGIVIMTTGWHRADPIASLIVAVVMAWTGSALVRAAGRVFLEAAPSGLDPLGLGDEMAAVDGVESLHDLHVWDIGSGETAVSAHMLVQQSFDCHEVSARVRGMLARLHGIGHVTLQTAHAGQDGDCADSCAESHGNAHSHVHSVPPAQSVASAKSAHDG